MHSELLTKEENIQKMKFYSTVNFEISDKSSFGSIHPNIL